MNDWYQDELYHYGTAHEGNVPHSGRYPWGSGKNPFQTSGDFLSRVEQLRSNGFSETEIAESLGLTTTQLRVQKSLAKDERRAEQVATAKRLREEGLSLNQIAEKMGFKNDSSVRSLLDPASEARMNAAKSTADFLKKVVAEKGMVEVGIGVEKELGISEEKLKQALYMLELEGYKVYGRSIPQVTNPGRQTTLSVLCPPGTEHSDIYDTEKIESVRDYTSYDDGETFKKAFVYPASMDSSRLQIRYREDGGAEKDGVIELRRGVDDLSLGDSHYAQVRILVDGDRYLKGMALYSDNLPDGVDVMFNTNKKKGTPMRDVLKKIQDDPDNPFGALIKEHGGQSYYIDKDGKEKLSLINKRAEEGDWSSWSDHLSSQFLSKQNLSLIKKQLNLTIAQKQDEFDEILALNNPAVKKAFLQTFAEDCDAAAVHLKAAALPRQKYQVILPLTTISENEVYAPNYKNGETVALVRYPHAGTFEIPILKVNNKQPEGRSVLGTTPTDAIGISSKTAERLSGADFDGDTVMVIPCNSSYTTTKIKSTKPLTDLEGFDSKLEYGGKKEGTFKDMAKSSVQKQMGSVSNLITDMTLKGATDEELARAVRHSMVVIDAYKHKLDYKQSEVDNGIAELKKKYQGHYAEDGRYSEGASTLISKASSEQSVLKRKGSPRIDPDTGEVSYKEVREEYIDKNGKTQVRTQKSTKMAETRDAYTLSSGTAQETLYAEYANSMKRMANEARKEIFKSGKLAYSPSAKKTYANEVASLDSKLNLALMNAPRERKAQILANTIVNAKKQDNPDLSKGELKKIKQQALTSSRLKVGAKRTQIVITDREWDAIQAGAISENKLVKIINHSDNESLRQRATPRAAKNTINSAKLARMKAMAASGYTTAEIADALGVSPSTVSTKLKGKE